MKLNCHCGAVEAEINVPVNELAKIVNVIVLSVKEKVQPWVWLKMKILKSLREKIN